MFVCFTVLDKMNGYQVEIQVPGKGKGDKRAGKGGRGGKEGEGRIGRGEETRERRENYDTEERECGRSTLAGLFGKHSSPFLCLPRSKLVTSFLPIYHRVKYCKQ